MNSIIGPSGSGKTRPLSVALVSREYPPFFGGGIGTYARWIVPALVDAGVRVHVITEAHDRTEPRVCCDGLVTVHRVPMGMGRGGWTNAALRFSINAGRKVAQLYRTNQIDIAEFAECEAAAIASLMFQKNSSSHNRIPTIVQLHTPSEQLFTLRFHSTRTLNTSLAAYFHFERLAIRLADSVLAPSRFIADWAHEHYMLSVGPTVIPYATKPLDPAPVPPNPNDSLRVLYAGRIEPRKGVESLVGAWSSVVDRHPRATLSLAGADTAGAPDGGSMRAYLLDGLDDRVRRSIRFLGRLNSNALANEYAQANLVVIPSLWENFPNTCIESMSNARPVLVSNAGGMGEMIADTQAGKTFVAGDENDLAVVLGGLLDEGAAALASRGRCARVRIEEMCDPGSIARLRIEHFNQVIESSPVCKKGQASARFQSWKSFEHLAAGDVPKIDLPVANEAVAKWVERLESSVC